MIMELTPGAAEVAAGATTSGKAEAAGCGPTEVIDALIETIDPPVYVVDARDYTVMFANRAARARASGSLATCYSATHGSDVPCFQRDSGCICPLEQVKRGGRPLCVEHVHRDESGVCRSVVVHSYPILDRNGQVVHLVQHLLDSTRHAGGQQGEGRPASALMDCAYLVSLVNAHNPHAIAPRILDIMARTAKANRCYWLEKVADRTGGSGWCCRAEWCAVVPRQGPAPAATGPEILTCVTAAMGRLMRGLPYCARTEELPVEARSLLDASGTRAVTLFPLVAHGVLVGVIGFEDPRGEGQWSESEIELFNTETLTLGMALERREVERRAGELGAVVESSPDGGVLTDLAGIIRYSNPAYHLLRGQPGEESVTTLRTRGMKGC